LGLRSGSEQQIPCGDDNKDSNGKGKRRSPAGMTNKKT